MMYCIGRGCCGRERGLLRVVRQVQGATGSETSGAEHTIQYGCGWRWAVAVTVEVAASCMTTMN